MVFVAYSNQTIKYRYHIKKILFPRLEMHRNAPALAASIRGSPEALSPTLRYSSDW